MEPGSAAELIGLTWKDVNLKTRTVYVNHQEIKHKLYQKGLSEEELSGRLEEVMFPVYQSAKSMGFSNWILRR